MARRSAQHLALGIAIRELRGARGMSQEQLALEAGIHRTYLGGIERGERNPSYTNLIRLAAALGIPLSEVIARAEGVSPGAERVSRRRL
jgi:transcriptional regulator with XRE-family HTH domain